MSNFFTECAEFFAVKWRRDFSFLHNAVVDQRALVTLSALKDNIHCTHVS
jgi:hypothetical protein